MTSEPAYEDRIDPGFARRIREVYGVAGATWLANLPSLANHFAAEWDVTLGAPFARCTYSWAAPGRDRHGQHVVLKLAVPSPQLRNEAEALRLYDGSGTVRLLAADVESGALLLERVLPGDTLAMAIEDDGRATQAAIDLVRRLWRPLPPHHRFPTLHDWARGLARHRVRFAGTTGPLPPDLFARAEEIFHTLLADAHPPMLLHGDLHHGNILSSGGGWLAIDPEGLAGEPEYELAAFMRNPYPALLQQPSPTRVISNRLARFSSELGFDRERVREWCFAHAVLSAAWSIEDHGGGWEYSIEVARVLAAIDA